jgi:hypothetical protein
MCSWMDALIFMPLFLELCIWPDVILQWILQENSECALHFVHLLEKSGMGYHGRHELDFSFMVLIQSKNRSNGSAQTHQGQQRRER